VVVERDYRLPVIDWIRVMLPPTPVSTRDILGEWLRALRERHVALQARVKGSDRTPPIPARASDAIDQTI
jgi:hypothetical protein